MHSSTRPQHYLFLLPESTTPVEQEAVVKSARELRSRGYVYVASTMEKTMEDRDDIRYLPLRSDSLPHFNAVAGVTVVRDQRLAHTAQQAYPGANVTVIDPAAQAPQQKPNAWRLVPWKAVHSIRIRPLNRVAMTSMSPEAA